MNPTINFDDLLTYLESETLQERQHAAIELSRIKDETIIPPLLDALNDCDSTVRANAAAGLGLNEAKQAVEALITLLQDSDDIVRERAATALAQIGDERSIDPLIDALDDSNTWTRNRIIYVLGASKNPRAVEPLIVQLDSENPSTQGVAAWALGAIGDKRAKDPLIGLLQDPDFSVRGNAAWALGELADENLIPTLLPLLNDTSPEVRGKTCWALGNIGEVTSHTEMVKALIPLLDDYAEIPNSSAHIFVCQYAAEALSQIGTDAANSAIDTWKPIAREKLLPRRIQDLIRAFRHKDLETRQSAISQLVEIGAAALDALVEALQSSDDARIRQGSAQTLGLLEDKGAVRPLIMALADPDIGVWSQAVAALAKLGKMAEKPLRPLLTSKETRVKQGVAIALWRIKREKKAFPVLLQALQDEELVVRGSAISSLWMQPDERAVATLQIRLQQEEGMMAKYILQALQTIGTPTAQATIAHWLASQGD
ncbi:MAG: HEAT repeat domain-containing protein [Anaerolineae bacterium]|nr:HEAT repeat domain-containing protein [Anaerolineae bacterium]